MAIHIRRGKFQSLLGGVAVSWPLTGRGQPRERVRRVSVLTHLPRTIRKDSIASPLSSRVCGSWVGPLAATCRSITAGPVAIQTAFAKYGIGALAPDVVLAASGTPLVVALQQAPAKYQHSAARPRR